MIRSNLLFSLYRQSDSLESFKRKVFDNHFHRPSDEPFFSRGFPLYEVIRMFVEDDIDMVIDADDMVVELLGDFLATSSTADHKAFIEQRMKFRVDRLLETYYAQYWYNECSEYQRAYEKDIEDSYEEKLAA